MIIVNFKTYQEGSGEFAVRLAKVIEEVAKTTDIPIIPAVTALDLGEVVSGVSIPVWIQNIDPITYGAHTGMSLAEEAKEKGAVGTLLNHSENKYDDLEKLRYAVSHAKAIGLKVLVFASDLDELGKVVEYEPDYVSYEPPDLIGSRDHSVAESQPEIIAKAVEICEPFNIPLIVGAGIHSQKDVSVSIQLRAKGVAVSTDVVKASDPKKELTDLLEGFTKL